MENKNASLDISGQSDARKNGCYITKKSLVVLVIAFISYFMLPLFLEQPYYLYLVNITGIHSILILGLNILLGYTGMMSMGHAGFFAIGAYTSTKIVMSLHLPWVVGILGGALTSMVFGILVGIPTNRIKDLTLALVTLGFGITVYRVIMSWSSFSGGPIGITDVPPAAIFGLEFKTAKGMFYLIYAILAALVILTFEISKMRVGRAFMAIKEDSVAAATMGINTLYYRVTAFAISAFYAGCAGSLFAHYIGYVSPDTFTFHHSITYISMVVIGGMGSVAGSILGAAGLTLAFEYFRTFSQYQMVVYGLFIILFVMFLPKGIAGIFHTAYQKVSTYIRKERE
jgi:branched-chain amino acid transport system permease protein